MRYPFKYTIFLLLFFPLTLKTGVRPPDRAGYGAHLTVGPSCDPIAAKFSKPLWRLPQGKQVKPVGSDARVRISGCPPTIAVRKHQELIVGYFPPQRGNFYLGTVKYFRARPRDPPLCSSSL